MSSQSQYRRKFFQCLMFAIFSAPLCLSPLTQCLQLRILCSDSASALCSVNEPSKVSQCPASYFFMSNYYYVLTFFPITFSSRTWIFVSP